MEEWIAHLAALDLDGVLREPAVLREEVGGRVRRRRRMFWVVAPALVLQGPTLVAAATGPWRALLGEPGAPVVSVAGPAWQQLLGWPTAGAADRWFAALPGVVESAGLRVLPLVATGVVVVLAVLALALRSPVARAVRFGWLVAAAGLATAVVVAADPVATAPQQGGLGSVVTVTGFSAPS